MEIVVHVLFQILIVIGVSRLVGLGFRQIKQPLVIGEIVAGIMLGPSLFGLIAPSWQEALFSQETIPFLQLLSQIGLIFFMFLIGLELDPKYLKNKIKVAILVSNVSILLPFGLGAILAYFIYPLVSAPTVSFLAFVLFLGAAMSITAFPVLARIITEHNLQGTPLGALALTCAAVDDITAWCLLAVAIAVASSSSLIGAFSSILYAALFIGFMLVINRMFLPKLATHYNRTGKLNQFLLAQIYMAVILSALITEMIGIHLIFGAFLLGVAMPKHEDLTRELAQKTEDFVLTLLLPIFFAYSGLNTHIGLLNNPQAWIICILVLIVAISGKFLGTYAVARLCRINNQEAAALGWLMNTRGLTELIVLNIGLNLKVISPLMFTILVVMAIVTTFITSPIISWLYPDHLTSATLLESVTETKRNDYRVLVPIANPNTQLGLIQLALAIALGLKKDNAYIYPLSLIKLEEDYVFESIPAEANRLIRERRGELEEIIRQIEPESLQAQLQPIVQISNDVAKETAMLAERERINLIIVGWHRPAFSNNRLGGRVGQILSTANTDVAVFVNQQNNKLDKLLVPYIPNIHNDLGLELAIRILSYNQDCELQIMRVLGDNFSNSELDHEFNHLMQKLPVNLRDRLSITRINTEHRMSAVVAASATVDLTIVGASREWGVERQSLGGYVDELSLECQSSLLITRKYSQATSHLTPLI